MILSFLLSLQTLKTLFFFFSTTLHIPKQSIFCYHFQIHSIFFFFPLPQCFYVHIVPCFLPHFICIIYFLFLLSFYKSSQTFPHSFLFVHISSLILLTVNSSAILLLNLFSFRKCLTFLFTYKFY